MCKIDNKTKYIQVKYKNKNYIIVSFKYMNENVPVVFDYNIYKYIINVNKKWYINKYGIIMTNHKLNGINKEIYLHNLIMFINNKITNNKHKRVPILHINKLYIDNRIENLCYDERNKIITKNLHKKTRTIDLSKYGINTNDIPSFVWYMKSDKSHGDRFVVKINDHDDKIEWKSSSSKLLSLRYKLEETKKYIRYLKLHRDDIFRTLSMNGDLNKYGHELLQSFINIIKNAGFNMKYNYINKTEQLIKEDLSGLSKNEIILLQSKRFT